MRRAPISKTTTVLLALLFLVLLVNIGSQGTNIQQSSASSPLGDPSGTSSNKFIPVDPSGPCFRFPIVQDDPIGTFLHNFQQVRAHALRAASLACLNAVAEGPELANLLGIVHALQVTDRRMRVDLTAMTIDAAHREGRQLLAVVVDVREARTPLNKQGIQNGPTVRDHRIVEYHLQAIPGAQIGGGWLVEDETIQHPLPLAATLSGPFASAILSSVNQSTIQQLASTATGADLLQIIAENGFAVHPQALVPDFFTDDGTLRQASSGIYARNTLDSVPSIITVDSGLHVYHLLQSHALLAAELTILPERLRNLLGDLLTATNQQAQQSSNSQVRAALLRTGQYLAVADLLAGGAWPADALSPRQSALAASEANLIRAHLGTDLSPYLGRMYDYSSFAPQGHYALSADLSGYAQAIQWLQVAAPALPPATATAQTQQASLQVVLLIMALHAEGAHGSLWTQWENIAGPLATLAGPPMGPSVQDFDRLVAHIYGANPSIHAVEDSTKLAQIISMAATLGHASHTHAAAPAGVGQTLMLIARSDRPDEQALVPTQPSDLSLLAALSGSSSWYLLNDASTAPMALAPPSQSLAEELARPALYARGLGLMRTLLLPVDPGSPAFMRTPAWTRVQAIDALGWWVEQHQDAQMLAGVLDHRPNPSDPSLIPVPRTSYIEPVPQAWDTLASMTVSLDNAIRRYGLLDGLADGDRAAVLGVATSYSASLSHIANIARLELAHHPLSTSDAAFIADPDSLLGSVVITLLRHAPSLLRLAGTQAAAPAQFASGPTPARFGAGEGMPQELWALTPINGRLYLARGLVYSYFTYDPTATPISNSLWQNGGWQQLQQPAWTNSFER